MKSFALLLVTALVGLSFNACTCAKSAKKSSTASCCGDDDKNCTVTVSKAKPKKH